MQSGLDCYPAQQRRKKQSKAKKGRLMQVDQQRQSSDRFRTAESAS
jgi:hypothetical protein